MKFVRFSFDAGLSSTTFSTGSDYLGELDVVTTENFNLSAYPEIIFDPVGNTYCFDMTVASAADVSLWSFDAVDGVNVAKVSSVDYVTLDASGFLVYQGVTAPVFVFDDYTVSACGFFVNVSRNVGNIKTDILNEFLSLKNSVNTKIDALPALVSGMVTSGDFQTIDFFDLNGNFGSYPNDTTVYLMPTYSPYTVVSSYMFQNDTDQFLIMYILEDVSLKKMVAPHNYLSKTPAPLV